MVAFSPGRTLEIILGPDSGTLDVHGDSATIQLLFASDPGSLAFITIGTGPVTGTFNGYPIPANTLITLNKGVGADTIAAVTNAPGVGGILYVTTGSGGG